MSRSVSKIIEELGGNTAVAKILDRTPSTVSEMKRRGSIPVEYWPRLIEAAHANGMELNAAELMLASVGPQIEAAQ